MNNIQISKYGQYVKGLNFYGDRKTCRTDKYTSNSGDVVHQMTICTGANDMSDVYNSEYNPKCSACWLGYGHTVNIHNQSLES